MRRTRSMIVGVEKGSGGSDHGFEVIDEPSISVVSNEEPFDDLPSGRVPLIAAGTDAWKSPC